MKKKPSKQQKQARSVRRQLDNVFGNTAEKQESFAAIEKLINQNLEMKMCGHKSVTLCKMP